LHDNRFWILWDYNNVSKSLSKFLCQFTIVIATESKTKYDDDKTFCFWVRVCSWFLQKFHFVWSFSVTFPSCGEELRARECFKPRVTIAIGMLSLWLVMKCGWNPTELTSGFTLLTYLVKTQISGPVRLVVRERARERERERECCVCVFFFNLPNLVKFWSEKYDFDLCNKGFSMEKNGPNSKILKK